MTSTARVPPHNIVAEESLLGAMLLSKEAIADVITVRLDAGDFYKPGHGHIFDAICTLYGAGEACDPVTVAEMLNRAGVLEAVGGPGVLITMQAGTPSIGNAGRYARIVEDHALLRRMIRVAGDGAELAYGLPTDVEAALDQWESQVFEVASRRQTDSTSGMRDLLDGYLDHLEALVTAGRDITGVPTGFIELDQQLSGLQPSNLIVMGGRPGMGKALALDTPLPTPTGWTTMGNVGVGDEVIDDQGRPCPVVAATPVMEGHRCYEVRFDDGATVVADADHQWFAYDLPAWKAKRERSYRNERGYTFNPDRNPHLARDQSARWRLPRVVTTQQMVDEGVRVGKDRRPNWYVPLARALQLPEQELPLDPYLLGVWLGDGTSSKASVTTEDQEIVEAFGAQGFRMVPTAPAGAAWTYAITFGRAGSHPWIHKIPDGALVVGKARVAAGERRAAVARELTEQYGMCRNDYVSAMLSGASRPYAADTNPSFAGALITLGVLRNKHIPPLYLRASEPQRRALLQGLMDTDGHMAARQNSAELTLSNLGLLRQVRELVLSLGERPGPIRPKVVRLNGRAYQAWRFNWSPCSQVFRLTRKVASQVARESLRLNGRITRRAITAITPVPSVPVRCISVDSPSHLYLAGEAMIPTHNTSLALGMAAFAAIEARLPVLVFSLEMSHRELTQRLVSAEARVDSARLRNGRMFESDWPKISHAVGRLGDAPLFIDDNPNLTIMEIRAKARRQKAKEGLSLVIIDYLQLMTGRHNAENRQVEIAEISRGLKILARELNVPVIALSQLSRNLESRADKRPNLADLRESGSLEQDADIVIFVYRDELYNRDSPDAGTAEVIVAKHRNGPVGSTSLAFLSSYSKFVNMARV